MHADDMNIVREFAASGSETAFANLVERHVNLVCSVALRQPVLNLHLGTGQNGCRRYAQRHHASSRRIASDHCIGRNFAPDTPDNRM